MSEQTMNLRATEEQKAKGLAAAAESRKYLAQVKTDMKVGKRSVEDVLNDPTCERMRVSQFLKAIPGIGKVRAQKIMTDLSIPENRRLKGLGSNQRTEIIKIAES